MVNRSVRRAVSRPGVTTDGKGSGFQSPFQPPSSVADFEGDLTLMDPYAYSLLHIADYFWRVKIPGPAALQAVAAIAESKGGQQIQVINAFLHHHLHPDDFPLVLRRLLDPEDPFTEEHYMDLYRQAVTVGTARPFQRSWAWPAPPPPAGDSCVANWLSAAYRPRSPR